METVKPTQFKTRSQSLCFLMVKKKSYTVNTSTLISSTN